MWVKVMNETLKMSASVATQKKHPKGKTHNSSADDTKTDINSDDAGVWKSEW